MTRELTQMQKLEERLAQAWHNATHLQGQVDGLITAIHVLKMNPNAGMERNPEAHCENCAYWLSDDKVEGYCNQSAIVATTCRKTCLSDFCGDHPNFWRVKKCTDAEQIAEATDGARR